MRVNIRKQPKQQRSRALVEAILDATARILAREGSERVTTNHVAEVAGVSVGSLYQYFARRDELIAAVAERHGQRMVAMLSDSVRTLGSAPVDEAVRSYVTSMLRAHALEPELHRAIIQHFITSGLENLAELDAVIFAVVRGYLELHRSEIIPDDLDAAAWVLMTTVRSLTHIGALSRPETMDESQLVDEVCAIVLRYLLGSAADTTQRLTITRCWDGGPARPSERVDIALQWRSKAGRTLEGLLLSFDAPLHGDPPPAGHAGSTPGLWDYEVVEVMLLGDDDRYLELEFGPHGHYLALKLHGVRNVVAEGMALEVTTTRDAERWRCEAVIPASLLPPGVNRVNAFAIHGVGGDRRYLALRPAGGDRPNFHVLAVFGDLDRGPGTTSSLHYGRIS